MERIFRSGPASAAGERERMARAVALLETLVGKHVGTSVDVARNAAAGPGQLDCVAESVNTSVYLLQLQNRGLLTYHRVEATRHRGFLIFYPHNTAVVRELSTDRLFAVDSWFGDNGEMPYVVPLEEWLDGWSPERDDVMIKGRDAPVSSELGNGI
ncbi:MAG: hypothetical protein AB7E32_15520 [Desulfovibrio sp.]